MKIVQINATCGSGSTGKICASISSILSAEGIENYILYSSGNSNNALGVPYMNDREVKIGALESRILGNFGFNSSIATKRMIEKLREIDPDIVHIHNIHGHNCNLEILFNYLKQKKIKIVWTFHDCWAFTGSCTYFTYVGCEKWKTECKNCPKSHEFSWFFDTSSKLFRRKKNLLCDSKMTIVTPSRWLAGLVSKSFLNNCKIKVIHNGIDLNVFKPTQGDFRSMRSITSMDKMILGVGYEWGQRKGLDTFIDLVKLLPRNYKIVLVGTNDDIDKQLPSNIISIHRTRNQKELAEIYSAADLFVNPTREDNYPTVNMEALACGTPVITFNTGGSPEILDETCGAVVEHNDVNELVEKIIYYTTTNPFKTEACLCRAKSFDQNERYREYLNLYREI